MNVSISKQFCTPQIKETFLVKVVLGLGLLTLLAKIRIFLPFTPVPITFQTYAIYILGLFMVPRVAICTVCSYLFLGLFAPVFCDITYGISVFFGPTGGYLLIMLPVVAVISFINSKYQLKSWQTACLLSLSAASILICGSLWLTGYLHVTSGASFDLIQGLMYGAYPFLLGEAIKIVLAIQTVSFYSFCKQKCFFK